MPKPNLESRREQLLKHIQEGELDFAATSRRMVPALTPAAPEPLEVPSLADDLAPPTQPEPFHFQEEHSAKDASLKARGWTAGNSLYDPVVRAAAMQMAREMGIHFAELQNVALGLVVDPALRPKQAVEMLGRLRRR